MLEMAAALSDLVEKLPRPLKFIFFAKKNLSQLLQNQDRWRHGIRHRAAIDCYKLQDSDQSIPIFDRFAAIFNRVKDIPRSPNIEMLGQPWSG